MSVRVAKPAERPRSRITRRTSSTVRALARAAVACCSRTVRSLLRSSASADRQRSVTSETSTAMPMIDPSSARAGYHCDS
jgi:hypothetical protein